MPTLPRSWPASSSLPRLREGEVQVWHLDLSCLGAAELETGAWSRLTSAEQTRAQAIRRPLARQEFVAGRAALRLLLEAATGTPAERIDLAAGASGKPYLAHPDAPHFNLTHSHGMVLIALSRAGAVGIDVERVDESVDVAELARAVFHRRELEELATLDDAERRTAYFYSAWTRKEAWAKASGRGLHLPLAKLDTTTGEWDGPGSPESRFEVRSLPEIRSAAGELYLAAIALATPWPEVQALRWPGLDLAMDSSPEDTKTGTRNSFTLLPGQPT